MEGTVTQQTGATPPASVFAQGIGRLAEQPLVGTTDDTTAPAGTIVDTTQVPVGTTDDTTQVPEGTTDNTTDAPTDDTPNTIIDVLRTQYGVDEALDNSIEGVQALIEKVSAKAKEDAIKAKLESNPILSQLDAHLQAGKSLDSFFQVKQVEAQKITLPPLTGDEKGDTQIKAYYKNVISANYKEAGLSDKQIARIIESSELENTLEADAQESAEAWNSRIDNKISQTNQAEEAARLQAIEDEKQIIADINKLVDGGKLNGAIIPQGDRQPLKDFMLKQDDKGYTARDYAFSKLTLEQQAVIDYLVFKNFNLKGFHAPAPISLDTLKGNNPLVNNNGGDAGSNAAATGALPKSLTGLDFGQLSKQ